MPRPSLVRPLATATALLLLGATVFLLGAMYVVCYTFFMASWEGWESWNRRTGLDAEVVEQERLRKRGLK